jgi:hydrogenase expression/formation protein HypE
MAGQLPAGKLPHDLLEECLRLCPTSGGGVLVGPGLGEDAAVLEPGTRVLLAKADPVTFVTERLGWYAVHVAANDIAASGGDPRWLLLTLLLPVGQATRESVLEVFAQVARACRDVGATLVGGHTEVTASVRSAIASAALLGTCPEDHWLATSGARTGDTVLLGGPCAVEGTAILAHEYRGALLRAGVAEGTLARASEFLDAPGISVLRAARIARAHPAVHAMHDPTEGGLLCGLLELGAAVGCSVRFIVEHVPVAEETQALCAALGVDPLRLIASGALLIASEPSGVSEVARLLDEGGLTSSVVGSLEEGPPRVFDHASGALYEVTTRDELARLSEKAGLEE